MITGSYSDNWCSKYKQQNRWKNGQNALPGSDNDNASILSWVATSIGVVPCASGLSSGGVEAEDDQRLSLYSPS